MTRAPLRRLALLLIPALVVDPATAYTFRLAASPWTPNQANSALFESQTLMLALAGSLFAGAGLFRDHPQPFTHTTQAVRSYASPNRRKRESPSTHVPEEIQEFDDWIRYHYRSLKASIVSLQNEGSGFAIAADETYVYIWTNSHVVFPYDDIRVTLSNKKAVIGKVLLSHRFGHLLWNTPALDIGLVAVRKSDIARYRRALRPLPLVGEGDPKLWYPQAAAVVSGYHRLARPAGVIQSVTNRITLRGVGPSPHRELGVAGDSGSPVIVRSPNGQPAVMAMYRGQDAPGERTGIALVPNHRTPLLKLFGQAVTEDKLTPASIFVTRHPELLEKAILALRTAFQKPLSEPSNDSASNPSLPTIKGGGGEEIAQLESDLVHLTHLKRESRLQDLHSRVFRISEIIWQILDRQLDFKGHTIIYPVGGFDASPALVADTIVLNWANLADKARKTFRIPEHGKHRLLYLNRNADYVESYADLRSFLQTSQVTLLLKSLATYARSDDDFEHYFPEILNRLRPERVIILDQVDARYALPILTELGYREKEDWIDPPGKQTILDALNHIAEVGPGEVREGANFVTPNTIRILEREDVEDNPDPVAHPTARWSRASHGLKTFAFIATLFPLFGFASSMPILKGGSGEKEATTHPLRHTFRNVLADTAGLVFEVTLMDNLLNLRKIDTSSVNRVLEHHSVRLAGEEDQLKAITKSIRMTKLAIIERVMNKAGAEIEREKGADYAMRVPGTLARYAKDVFEDLEQKKLVGPQQVFGDAEGGTGRMAAMALATTPVGGVVVFQEDPYLLSKTRAAFHRLHEWGVLDEARVRWVTQDWRASSESLSPLSAVYATTDAKELRRLSPSTVYVFDGSGPHTGWGERPSDTSVAGVNIPVPSLERGQLVSELVRLARMKRELHLQDLHRRVFRISETIWQILDRQLDFKGHTIIYPVGGFDASPAQVADTIVLNWTDLEEKARQTFHVPKQGKHRLLYLNRNADHVDSYADLRSILRPPQVTLLLKSLALYAQSDDDFEHYFPEILNRLRPERVIILNQVDARYALPLLSEMGYREVTDWIDPQSQQTIQEALDHIANYGPWEVTERSDFGTSDFVTPDTIRILEREDERNQPRDLDPAAWTQLRRASLPQITEWLNASLPGSPRMHRAIADSIFAFFRDPLGRLRASTKKPDWDALGNVWGLRGRARLEALINHVLHTLPPSSGFKIIAFIAVLIPLFGFTSATSSPETLASMAPATAHGGQIGLGLIAILSGISLLIYRIWQAIHPLNTPSTGDSYSEGARESPTLTLLGLSDRPAGPSLTPVDAEKKSFRLQDIRSLYEISFRDDDTRRGLHGAYLRISFLADSPYVRQEIADSIAAHLKPSDQVLSVGVGSGLLEKDIRAHHPTVRFHGIDLVRPLLKRASAGGLRSVEGDGHHLPFAEDSFDTVIIPESLGHMDASRAFQEAFRVLRPGGRLYVISYGKLRFFGQVTVRMREKYRLDDVEELETMSREIGYADFSQVPLKTRFRPSEYYLVQAQKPGPDKLQNRKPDLDYTFEVHSPARLSEGRSEFQTLLSEEERQRDASGTREEWKDREGLIALLRFYLITLPHTLLERAKDHWTETSPHQGRPLGEAA